MESFFEFVKFNAEALTGGLAALVSIMVAVISITGALRSGVLKRVRFGSIEIESPDVNTQELKKQIEAAITLDRQIPFEVEQLANYYSQVLSQSKISFWFSLIFASLGFSIIVLAAFLYSDASSGSTIAQFIAGLIMDAVAGLFFVQSRSAQKSMGEFFDKLRHDRMHVESRNLCDSIENSDVSDALKVRLSLFYAGMEGEAEQTARSIIDPVKRDSEVAPRGPGNP